LIEDEVSRKRKRDNIIGQKERMKEQEALSLKNSKSKTTRDLNQFLND